MTRSYNVDIALAVGGVPEAIVLKEITFWCGANEAKGTNRYDGRYWTYNSVKAWQEKFPEFKGSVGTILKHLVDGGWLLVGNYNKTPFDRTKWYSPTNKTISLFAEMDLPESQNGFDGTGKPIPTDKPISKQTIEEILKKNAAVIDRLYALYPAKTYRGERGSSSTGKCSKDKQRIAALLREHTPEEIERSINKYVEEMRGQFLKNFSTFLNNMPEYEDDTVQPSSQEEQLRALGYQG